MKKILVFFMFLLSLTSLAERFIVISKDGYANLREEASTKSKVLAKVDNSYTIIGLNEYNSKRDGWYCVRVEKNLEKNDCFFEWGYIHKSQLDIHPETYVLSSKDDYVNVRSKPSISSEILDGLYVPNYHGYLTRHPEKTVGDWYYMDYLDYYDDGEVPSGEGGESILAEGYIHKSQLKKFKK